MYQICDTLSIHPASMGPQLYRCGNRRPAVYFSSLPCGLQWGRNFIVAEIARQAGYWRQFCQSLQWGRNFIVAEIRIFRVGKRCRRRLQWGRNFIVAEMAQLQTNNARKLKLQWGRNFIVAEMECKCVQVYLHSICFNGAATLSLRKFAGRTKITNFNPTSFNGAATLSLRKSQKTSKKQGPCVSFNGAATLSLRK